MTLTRLLEINLKLIQPLEYASIEFANRIWQKNGSPTGIRELIDLLERVLSECQKGGERYAPILLQRKRALQRGTWAPREECLAALSQTSEDAPINQNACTRCGGSGYVSVRAGTAVSLCPCDAWKNQRMKPA
jgi:hypothetical protein